MTKSTVLFAFVIGFSTRRRLCQRASLPQLAIVLSFNGVARRFKRFTGSGRFGASAVVRAGSSVVEPGFAPSSDVTLHWRTFDEAADEAGLSRRFGGIHFKEGDLESRRMGKEVGIRVWRKALRYFRGGVTATTN